MKFSLLLIVALAGLAVFAPTECEFRAAVPPQNAHLPSTHVAQPDSCMIVATQAVAELRPYAAWVEILRFDIYTQNGHFVGNHVVAVWVPWKGGPVMLYDQFIVHGTLTLVGARDDHDAPHIIAALQNARPAFIFKHADFIR